MRREQVLKLCLNQFLLKDMNFLEKGEKAWIWYGPDFSEGVVVNEQLCVRFRDAETAGRFKTIVDKLKEEEIASPTATSGKNIFNSRGPYGAFLCLCVVSTNIPTGKLFQDVC